MCPQCGAVYAKVKAHLERQAATNTANAPSVVAKKPSPSSPKPKDKKLKPCPDCGQLVSRKAQSCPHCGSPLKAEQNSGCATLFVAVLVLGVLGYAFSPSETSSPPESTGAPPQSVSNSKPEASPKPATPASSTPSDAECRRSLQCWGDRHTVAAGVYCRKPVERLARFSFEWTDAWYEPKFSHFRWKDQARGTITFIGDKIRMQNAFGAWQNFVYECDLDPATDAVLDVRARPGMLQ